MGSTSTKSLDEFAVYIKYANDPNKLRLIQSWLEKFFSREGSFWDTDTPEVLNWKEQLSTALESLIQKPSDRPNVVELFKKAHHYEFASGNFKSPKDVNEFVNLLEWTLANDWVISKIDPSSKLTTDDVPRWLLSHADEVRKLM